MRLRDAAHGHRRPQRRATRRRLLAGAAAVLAVAAVLVSPSAALAAGGWSVQPIPAAPRPDGRSAAVSCASTTACMSVGRYIDQYSVPRTLAQRWDGATWLSTATPNRADAVDSRLTGVSCRSASLCLAVGYYTDRAGVTKTLAERWDGTSWHITATPNRAGAQENQLSAVSCRSVTLCVAVGWYAHSGNFFTLASRWDGTSWHTTTTPNPADSIGYTKLQGVSCPTISRCIAVGYDISGGSKTLVEQWNGTTWTIISTPNQDPRGNELSAVSCASASSCTAVGFFRSGKLVGTLAEEWDGATWVIRDTPATSGSLSRQAYLSAVSCASPDSCSAVGNFSSSPNGQVRPLAEVWDGATWTITTAAGTKANVNVLLTGVSCPAADGCTAVGYGSTPYNDRTEAEAVTLAQTWDGTAWTKVATPNRVGPQSSRINSVSCASADQCTAVGGVFSPVPLIDRWDGAKWSVVSVPAVPGASQAELNGVSCASASACMAVGSSYADSNTPLAAVWDGVRWQIVTTPQLSNAILTAVSCSSATACTAVGYSFGDNPDTLVETWDGTSWTIADTPTPGGAASSQLQGVSCTSASSCVAVGYSTSSSGRDKPLAETWNGTRWTIAAVPQPTDVYYSHLQGVSCTSATSCTAVGFSANSADYQPLIETWDGTSWTIAATPTLDTTSALYGVSCTSASLCTADGYTSVGSGHRPLVETWDGVSWTQDTQADPGYLRNVVLNSVSCVSSVGCTTVGRSSPIRDYLPFAESTFP